MNKKYPALAAAGLITIISAALLLAGPGTKPDTGFSFTYNDANKDLQLALVESGIHMSSPLRLNGFSIEKYCTFFSSDAIQESIRYCTSTEILDSTGSFLGNIQMAGMPQQPQYVIGAIQTDHAISQYEDLVTIIQTMVEGTVCHCWEELSPGGFATVADWVDAAWAHHQEGTLPTSKSRISGLDRALLLEITANPEGYLWKLVIFG